MVEIFSSIQGEGKHVGLRQAFLRFHGCSLHCHYCDSRTTLSEFPPEFCQTERTPGRQDFMAVRNPVSLQYIKNILCEWVSLLPNAHHSISLTGGEPLLHIDLLLEYLPELRKILPVYLETNGIHYNELSKCIDFLDFISMDFKLPSTTKSQDYWEDHRKFLEIAKRKDVYVKVVVSNETSIKEIRKACEVLVSVNRNIPLILQPLTSKDVNQAISSRLLFELQEEASNHIKEIRIIPQTHIYMHLL
ncbi:MAG: 7-carboxy-7-deazaguanine synthase QueE [Geobacteraceae bacterium]|nr:7-carboxy-7-deazaguanine synthase QueE [Geobacteraceae bacterium]